MKKMIKIKEINKIKRKNVIMMILTRKMKKVI